MKIEVRNNLEVTRICSLYPHCCLAKIALISFTMFLPIPISSK